jgi:xanthine/uracil/vitamin C permease (AzgA family)
MNLPAMLKELLALLKTNPQAALAAAQGVLALLRLNPNMLATMIPSGATLPVLVYIKAHPVEGIDFLSDELTVLGKNPALFAAVVASIPLKG